MNKLDWEMSWTQRLRLKCSAACTSWHYSWPRPNPWEMSNCYYHALLTMTLIWELDLLCPWTSQEANLFPKKDNHILRSEWRIPHELGSSLELENASGNLKVWFHVSNRFDPYIHINEGRWQCTGVNEEIVLETTTPKELSGPVSRHLCSSRRSY